jgi:hypothetical protein
MMKQTTAKERAGGVLTRRSRMSASQEAGVPAKLKGIRRKPLILTVLDGL